jgi:hypothetical protein
LWIASHFFVGWVRAGRERVRQSWCRLEEEITIRVPWGVVEVVFLRRGRRRVVRIWWPMQFVVKIGSIPWLFRGVMGWMPRPGLKSRD